MWRLAGALVLLLWLILSWIVRELFKDAIFSWVNQRLAMHLGLSEPEMVAIAATYGAPLLASAAIVLIAWWIGAKRYGLPRLSPRMPAEADTVPDYAAWARLDPLEAYQAACLWAEVEPKWPLPRKANLKLQLLIRLAEARIGTEKSFGVIGRLRLTPGARDRYDGPVDHTARFTRDELRSYIESIGDHPAFLAVDRASRSALRQSLGRWFGARFVLDQPLHVFTTEVRPQDSGRVYTFEIPQAPPRSLVRWKIEIDARHRRAKAQILMHPNQPPFNWEAIQTPITSGAVRVSESRQMHLVTHCLPETDPTIIRVYALGWGDDESEILSIEDSVGIANEFDEAIHIRLSDAALTAYRQMRGTMIGVAAEKLGGNEAEPDPVGWLAAYLAFTKRTPLYGIHVLSGEFEQLPEKCLESGFLSADHNCLEEFGKKHPVYKNLALKREDFSARLQEMRQEWSKGEE